MNTEVSNFLNNLSEEQIETLKQLLNKENFNDESSKETKKDHEAASKTEKEKKEEKN